jgi:hypothetical protein
MDPQTIKLQSQLFKSVQHVLESLLSDYVSLERSGAQVLGSMCNLGDRVALFSRASESSETAEHLLGPLIYEFDGESAELESPLCLRLLQRHRREYSKQRGRNLGIVLDGVREATAKARELWRDIDAAISERIQKAGNASVLTLRSAEAPVAISELLASADTVRTALAMDAMRKAELLAMATRLTSACFCDPRVSSTAACAPVEERQLQEAEAALLAGRDALLARAGEGDRPCARSDLATGGRDVGVVPAPPCASFAAKPGSTTC